MQSMGSAKAFVFCALTLAGCATSTTGAEGRAHTSLPADSRPFAGNTATARTPKAESPTVHACRIGSAKACDELGDRLMIKHAYSDAHAWYALACEQARSAMMPTAAQLLQLSHELTQSTQNPARALALKADAAQLTARLRGCFDAAETLSTEHELGQALPYYETTCEFSALTEAVGDSIPTFAIVVERACASSNAAHAELHSPAFSPQLFHDLAEQANEATAEAAGEAAPEAPATDMVFSMSDVQTQ